MGDPEVTGLARGQQRAGVSSRRSRLLDQAVEGHALESRLRLLATRSTRSSTISADIRKFAWIASTSPRIASRARSPDKADREHEHQGRGQRRDHRPAAAPAPGLSTGRPAGPRSAGRRASGCRSSASASAEA